MDYKLDYLINLSWYIVGKGLHLHNLKIAKQAMTDYYNAAK